MNQTEQLEETAITIELEVLLRAYELMCCATEMAAIYETNRDLCKYVHSTSRGHEAIQLAVGMQLTPQDFVAPYYRDESMLLGIGLQPHELMLQLLAKRDDPFSGGRTYYSHPSLRRADMPKIPHQSSATGMQAIPATGAAHGIKYLESINHPNYTDDSQKSIVVCSLGDGSTTEGEVSEALQMAVLQQLPILYLVQDNTWSISASAKETRGVSVSDFAKGFPNLAVYEVDGTDFLASFGTVSLIFNQLRKKRTPALLHARVPLIGHHTSGVRREWYRQPEEIALAQQQDPRIKLKKELLNLGIKPDVLDEIERQQQERARLDFEKAKQAPEPDPATLKEHIFAPTPITEERGIRVPTEKKEVVMVDAVLHAVDEIFQQYPEALLYGQDVGGDLGGVFREAATLAKKYGHNRVFNTPIQEAYIIGSTVGMSAASCKPIVEIQFADYIWPGLNQLFTEVSRSCYLSNGKWPVQALIRVPTGAYGSGGPFHSSSIESTLLTIRGVKIVYPSNAADMKGLFKAAFLDPNPVIILEHKGLYWSKVQGSQEARTIEPDSDYIIPLGKARLVQESSPEAVSEGTACTVITYGMGVHWAKNASTKFKNQVEILDLRTLEPIDWQAIEKTVVKNGKVMILTEEPTQNSFAESLAGRISSHFFTKLDAPVQVVGSENLPAIPLNITLEQTMLPNAEKVSKQIEYLLNW